MEHSEFGHFGPSDDFFQGPKGQICHYLGRQNDLICSLMDILESPGWGPKVYKWVTDALTVHIGQLDNYVVFGTKSGAFQRGTKYYIGDKQTLLDRC